MAAALKRGDGPAMVAADAGFHDLVVELAANPVLIGMVGPMRDMMVESQRLPMVRLDRLGETLAEHRAIAARLAAQMPTVPHAPCRRISGRRDLCLCPPTATGSLSSIWVHPK